MTTRVEFVHRTGGHCGSSALRDLLQHHDLRYGDEPLSEGMVFGLAGALAFAFAERVVPFENPDISLPLYLNGRSESLESDLCAHAGIELDLRTTDDPDEGWRWLREELDAGRPTMVWANQKDLSYQRVKLDNTRHDVVVCSYDAEAGAALVADHDYEELQACTLESLARARASQAFPGPPRHATYVTRFPDRLPPPAAAIAAGLRRAVATMRHAEPVLWEISDSRFGRSKNPYLQGLRGVDAFAECYARLPERFGDGTRDVLRLTYVLLERAGTGGGFYRGFQATFLEQAAELLDDGALAEASQTYRRLASLWSEIAWIGRSGDTARGHARALELVREAQALEHEGVAQMESWLDHGRRRAA